MIAGVAQLDIVAACAALRSRGVRLEGEPHVVGQLGDKDVWLAHFYDMEGNLQALTSETARVSGVKA